MFKGTIANGTSVANADIPFVTALNTNDRTSNNNGVISLHKAGYYNVDATLTVAGVSGNIVATLYADGVATDTQVADTLDDTSDIATLSLTDAIRVVQAQYPNVGNISIRLNTAGLSVSGRIIVEYVR